MGVYKRGDTYWYKFRFDGQIIRESARTNSKTIAREAERTRRRELEVGVNGLSRRERPLFATAAKDWLARKTNLTPLGVRYYRQYIAKLSEFLGKRLISDITAEDVADLQSKRKSQRLSGRHINAEVGTLRAILRYYGRWAYISGRVTMLPQRSDAGRSLTQNEEARLLEAIGHSRSPSLYPFFTLSIDAGLRPSETRALRRSNLRLSCHGGSISAGEIIVGRSKSEAGEGRAIPRVAIAGNQRVPHIYDINLDRPMSPSSYRTAFETACRRANVRCRFYDARHTFVTRLAENPGVSEETIRQLAGHVSPRMLARYAHIRAEARRAAIATLDSSAEQIKPNDLVPDAGQKLARWTDSTKSVLN